VAVLRLQNWMEVPRRLVVAVDGGVFLKYANWRKFLRQYLCEAFGKIAVPTCDSIHRSWAPAHREWG